MNDMKKITGTDIQRMTAVLGMVMSLILIIIDRKNIAIGLILLSVCSASLTSCKKRKDKKIENK